MKGRHSMEFFWILVKGFDTLPHRTPLDKVSSCGIRGLGEELPEEQCCEQADSELGYTWFPQGSILGAVLLNVHINDLGAGAGCTISRFAVETEPGGAVGSPEGQDVLQRDLDMLDHWAAVNRMKFNKPKYWITHLGSKNDKQCELGEGCKLGEPCRKESGGAA